MEKPPIFGGAASYLNDRQKASIKEQEDLNPEEQQLAVSLEAAADISEVIQALGKIEGLARSDGKMIPSSEIITAIVRLIECKAKGLAKDSMPVKMSLNSLTRKAGLRKKVEDLIFSQ